MLDSASRWLDSVLATSEGKSVTYRRGAEEATITDAVIGETPIGSDFGAGIIQTWQSRDFMIEADELILGTLTLPESGDTIQDGTVVYRVTEADDGRCWRYCDESTRDVLRIHTRQDSRR